jgi:hypothetical protein
MPTLRLIRASKPRPSGTWSADDYYVRDDDWHFGRIVWELRSIAMRVSS